MNIKDEIKNTIDEINLLKAENEKMNQNVENSADLIHFTKLLQQKGDEWAFQAGILISEEECVRKILNNELNYDCLVRCVVDTEVHYLAFLNGKFI